MEFRVPKNSLNAWLYRRLNLLRRQIFEVPNRGYMATEKMQEENDRYNLSAETYSILPKFPSLKLHLMSGLPSARYHFSDTPHGLTIT
jgi:hypothetical protein